MKHNEILNQLLFSESNHFKVILDNSLDAVITVDQDGEITYYNRAAQALFGYSENELIGKNAAVLMDTFLSRGEDYLSRFLKILEKQPVGYGREVEAIDKSGKKFKVFLTFSHYTVDDHYYLTVFIKDYSRLSTYEKELQKLSLVASKTSNGVVITDKNKRIEWVNEGFTRLTGYTLKEVEGEHPGKFLHGKETNPETRDRIRSMLQQKESFTETILNYTKAGEPYWNSLYITPILDVEGNVERFIAIQSDITEITEARKKEERNNQELRHYTRYLLTLNKLFANNSGLQQLTEDLLCTGIEMFQLSHGILSSIHGDEYTIKGVVSPITDLRTGMKFKLESTYCDAVVKEKKTIFYSMVGTIDKLKDHPVYKEMKLESYIGTPVFVNDKLYGTLNFSSEEAKKETQFTIEAEFLEIMAQMIGRAIESDIARTEKDSMLITLQAAKEKAEESEKVKEMFLANTSHELRTPMNIIIGMLEVLKRTELNKRQLEFVNIIENTSENLLYLLNDLLDISKIESGKLEFETTGFRLRDIISSVVETGTYLAEKKNITFNYACADDSRDLIVRGDPVRLSQVLYNLTSNAIKFTEKGSVMLIASPEKELDSGITIRFDVKDTGIGIPNDKLESIFQGFEQVDTSTTRKYGGTGLGLSISKQLVELMGGELRVESQMNMGSIFSFTLTFSKGTTDDLPETLRSKLASGLEQGMANLRILVAEDNKFNAMIISELLTPLNCDVDIAGNGEEAVAKLKENNYHLILMDVQMPVMDGVEATQYIRNNLPSPKSDIPIVALTAHAIKGDKEKYLQYGMNDYLSKPYKPYELKAVISKALNLNIKSSEVKEPPPSVPVREEEVVDLSQLREIAGDDPDFIRQSIGTFLEYADEALASFELDNRKNQYEDLAQTIHRIKPSFSMMGLTQIYQQLIELEELCQDGQDHTRIEGLIQEIIVSYQPVSEKLHSEIDKL
ncbi:MAG: PAS domain-containing protein [Bacteroidales bacterium]|nr:PAS domain-containing protein [Bacteroidales bacterium]